MDTTAQPLVQEIAVIPRDEARRRVHSGVTEAGPRAARAGAALVALRWARRDTPHICLGCGTVFKGVPEQQYCTPRCRVAAGLRRLRARRRAAADSAKDSVPAGNAVTYDTYGHHPPENGEGT